MAVFAYLGGAWRQAKCVWWWNGSAWLKAKAVHRWDGSAWQQGFDAPDLQNTVAGATDSGTAPAQIVFTWAIVGQLYGATVELVANGIGYGALDAVANPSGITLDDVDPTATWTAELRDGNGDVVRTRSVTITGP
jgi:hypothetical protein